MNIELKEKEMKALLILLGHEMFVNLAIKDEDDKKVIRNLRDRLEAEYNLYLESLPF